MVGKDRLKNRKRVRGFATHLPFARQIRVRCADPSAHAFPAGR
ncbi:hypothetical protein [Kingella potus]|nr:hypothetical protein [Kingella potus]